MPRWLYALLLAIPLALLGRIVHWPPGLVFLLAAAGLVPLAGLIGVATGALAEHVGSLVGGLLNATFGNAAELIIGVTALAASLPDVVRASITGSIIGNSLLVLGSSMLAGGWRYGLQTFNARHAGQYASMLALAIVGLVVPSLVASVGGGSAAGQNVVRGVSLHELSVVVAVILLISYVGYIAFSVFGVRASPRALSSRNEEGIAPDDLLRHGNGQDAGASQPDSAESPRDAARAGGSAASNHRSPTRKRASPSKRSQRSLQELWQVSPWPAVAVLAGATALTALVSEALVGTIEPVAHEVGLSPFFVGLIVIPLVGNAAEHSSAIGMALRDHMDVTMAITAGSSIQVALLVAPVLVLASVVLRAPLDLNFTRLELVIFGLIGGVYALVSLDGESTWLEGLQLCAFYLIVAVVAFFIPG